MHSSQKETHWIQANRHALQTFAEFVHLMPDPISMHRGAKIEDCHVTVEPYDDDQHGDVSGLIITDAFVTHVGRVVHRDGDTLASLSFHTIAGLRAMYANLSMQFWQLVDSDVADYITQLQSQIDLVSQYRLPKSSELAGRTWLVREMETLPDYLSAIPINHTTLIVRELGGVVFGLELIDITSLGHCYEVATCTVTNKASIKELMADLLSRVNAQQPTAVPTLYPLSTVAIAMASIAKTIEECLTMDLGRAACTVKVDSKNLLKRTLVITAPIDKTLIAVTKSIYSTCVKMGKDRKHGCSVTMSQFAHSVVVTITPTDRVIHI